MNQLPPLRWLCRSDERHRLVLAVAIGVAASLFAWGEDWLVRLIAGWNGFAAATSVLSWLYIAMRREVRSAEEARIQDYGRTVIFMAVLSAACISLLAVGFLLASGKKEVAGNVWMAVGTVVNGWFLIHTLFTLRYAHLYHDDDEATGGLRKGIAFPEEENPDYLDFAYFSFVIGMTAQTSDVNITGKDIRFLALLHGLVSFLFNTAILALGINVVSGLLSE